MGPAVTASLGFLLLCLCSNTAHSLSLKPICPGNCKMFCPNGFVEDRNGCPICRCRPGLPTRCPLVRCPLYLRCPFGFADDVNGCPTCSCKSGPVCEPIDCNLRCRIGRVKDMNGCDICRCRLPDPLDCPLRACPPFDHCPNGYIIDSRGCNTCRCKPDINPCPVRSCPPCPNGYVHDSRGCQTCTCKAQDCPPFLCHLSCNRGRTPWSSLRPRRPNHCQCDCPFDQLYY